MNTLEKRRPYVFIKKTIIFHFSGKFSGIQSARNDRSKIYKQSCATSQTCKDLNNNCKCYCSRVCHFRDKFVEEDTPVYVENDPNGIHCYCKQWDLDHYQERCARKTEQQKNLTPSDQATMQSK